MHPTGTATAQCLLFINQGEQREPSLFVALAKEKDLKRKEDNRFSWEYNRAHLICSVLFFFFPLIPKKIILSQKKMH